MAYIEVSGEKYSLDKDLLRLGIASFVNADDARCNCGEYLEHEGDVNGTATEAATELFCQACGDRFQIKE